MGKRIKRKFEGKEYTISELYSLRNRLREKLIKADPLEELFLCPSASEYEADGVLEHVKKLKKEIEKSEDR